MDIENPEQREKCIWQPSRKANNDRTPCNSEQDIHRVTHRNWYGQKSTDPICGKHMEKAWGKLRVESAEKRPNK